MKTRRQLCYDTSLYQRILFDGRKGRGSLKNSIVSFTKALCKTQNADASTPRGRAMADMIREDVEDVAAEAFARAYADPNRMDQPTGEVPWSTSFHGILEGLPEWQSSRASTKGDPDLAAIAVAAILTGVQEHCEELSKMKNDEDENDDEDDDTNSDVVRIRIALRAAAGDAFQQGLKAKSAMNVLFPGMGAPPPQW